MDKDSNKNSPQEEGNEMALLARPSESMIKIDSKKTNQFLADRKKNAIKPEFLKQCQQYNQIMNRNRQK